MILIIIKCSSSLRTPLDWHQIMGHTMNAHTHSSRTGISINVNILTSNCLEEDSARSSEMEWTSSWVDVTAFTQVVQVLDFVSAIGKQGERKCEKLDVEIGAHGPIAGRLHHNVNLPVEMSGEGQFFASYNDNFTTLQKVFGYNGCKTSDQMAATVDNYGLQETNKQKKINFQFFFRFRREIHKKCVSREKCASPMRWMEKSVNVYWGYVSL